MRIINRIVGIDGVSTGATPRIKLPVNRRYHSLKFFCFLNGVAAAAGTVVERVRIYVNGLTIRDVAVSRLLAIAALNGKTVAVGELPIHFSEPWRADKIDEVLTAWDMFGEGTFEVELVCVTQANPADIPSVTGICSYDFGQTLIDGKPMKAIIRQTELGKNAVAGVNDFDNLPIRDPLNRVLLFAAANDITAVEVTADRNKVYEGLLSETAALLNDYGLVSTAVAGYPVCFDHTEQIIGDALVVARDLNLRFTKTAAGAVTALVEARASGFY